MACPICPAIKIAEMISPDFPQLSSRTSDPTPKEFRCNYNRWNSAIRFVIIDRNLVLAILRLP
jgi:hypothetical protein